MSSKTERFTSLPALAAVVLTAVSVWATAQSPAASAPVAVVPVPSSAPVGPADAAPQAIAPAAAGGLPLVSSPGWSELTVDQRLALAPLERDWNTLDDARRRIWLEMVPGFTRLPDEERNRLHERMRAWVALSPAERQRARINFQLAKQSLHASEREARWEAYQALPPERRQELAEKAAARKRQLQAGKPSCLPGTNCALDPLKAQPKSNRVPEAVKRPQVKSVAPSLVQARPGVTTVLITQAATPTVPVSPGLTKVIADPNLVDPNTLLPRRQPVAPVNPAPPPSSAQ